MSSSTLIEVFGQIVFSFTRGVTEHYNPEEPEFTAESFGYNPLETTGREWYCQPVDEMIYQEYSDREATHFDYLASRNLDVRVINACSPEENEGSHEEKLDEDRSMAWKRLRPSVLHTVFKSMYIGALISLVTATIIGIVYMLVSYVSYKFGLECQFHPRKLIPKQVQWMRCVTGMIAAAFLYIWYFVLLLLSFRPFQLIGVKRKLILTCFFVYCLDSLYRVALQTFGISYSVITGFLKVPLNALFVISMSWQSYIVTNHLCVR